MYSKDNFILDEYNRIFNGELINVENKKPFCSKNNIDNTRGQSNRYFGKDITNKIELNNMIRNRKESIISKNSKKSRNDREKFVNTNFSNEQVRIKYLEYIKQLFKSKKQYK